MSSISSKFRYWHFAALGIGNIGNETFGKDKPSDQPVDTIMETKKLDSDIVKAVPAGMTHSFTSNPDSDNSKIGEQVPDK